MDLYLFRRRQYLTRFVDQRPEEISGVPERRFAMRVTDILATFLVILPVVLVLLMIIRHELYDQRSGFAEARVIQARAEPNVTSVQDQPGNAELLKDQIISLDDRLPEDQKGNAHSLEDGSAESSQADDKSDEKLLGGLLASSFEEDSCLSRYQSFLYRKVSTHKPCPYLLSQLRAYEDLHKECGPGTESYSKAVGLLKSGHSIGSEGCKYIVWMSCSGLGNRIISIVSAFLYALLTNRILLLEGGEQISDLFCEPFPETSWLLPLDFPIMNQFNSFGRNSVNCHGNMLKKQLANVSSQPSPSHLYLHLAHDYGDHDKMFFCDEDQSFLSKVPWLIMRTNNYFVPSLFLMPSFEDELGKLFPEKATVFQHLGRYLFHPSNFVWGLITRYYQAYLAKADERIGIQIRVFDEKSGISPHLTRQILSCIQSEKLLPGLSKEKSVPTSSKNPKLKAVLVASLTTGYLEILKSMYWENPTVTGDVIGVYQPSHEGHQQTVKLMHNRKAWAEMYLLSLTDKLVISAWSTFRYVAQGLGGLKCWILYKPNNQNATVDLPCGRARSSDPCFHAPPYYDCKAKRGIDTGNLVPHVRHCEDISWGLKVVDES